MRKWLRNLLTSKRTALLEAENMRLRETNLALEAELEQSRKETRAAVNTLLSQAGVTPLPPAEEVKTYPERMRRLTWQQRQRLHALETASKAKIAAEAVEEAQRNLQKES
jgi:hypothetical protein